MYTVLTVSRNGAWKDNETLFFTDIAVSRTSAKLNSACGGELLTRALASKDQDSTELLASQAFPFLDAAIVIHPTYGVAFYNRATCNILVKNYRQAVEDARVALRFNGDVKASTILLARALRDRGKYEGETDRNAELAITSLLESWQLNTTDAKTAHLLGIGYGILGKHTESLSWFSRAVDIAPQDAQYVFDLGTAYYYNGNKAKRDEYHKRAQELR
jgi:tetratricopeptide (TPR) repeat protein